MIGDESIFSVAIDEGLTGDGILHSWVKNYKENYYNIVERKRDCLTMKKKFKPKKKETKENILLIKELLVR